MQTLGPRRFEGGREAPRPKAPRPVGGGGGVVNGNSRKILEDDRGVVHGSWVRRPEPAFKEVETACQSLYLNHTWNVDIECGRAVETSRDGEHRKKK